MTGGPLSLFYSYAHEDEALRNELAKQLRILERAGLISSWHDREIDAGRDWSNNISQHMKEARIILLLVSPDFLSSDYCYDVEMAHALDRHNREDAVVIPIVLRPTLFDLAPFAKLQGLPRDARPVTEWRDRDEAFVDVAAGIRRVAERIRSSEADGSAYLPSEGQVDPAALDRDIKRVSEYRQLFIRSAFSIPCVFEDGLSWLDKALDQIAGAFGTGMVVSRGTTTYSVPRRTEFETKRFASALDQASRIMLFTKRSIAEFQQHLQTPGVEARMRYGESSVFHMEFFLRDLIRAGVARDYVSAAFDYMDRIDAQRNAVLELLNGLFEKERGALPPIPISSALLEASAAMDRTGRRYDWSSFYLSEHETIRTFLSSR